MTYTGGVYTGGVYPGGTTLLWCTPPYPARVHQPHPAHAGWVTGYTAGGQWEEGGSWAREVTGSLGRALWRVTRARSCQEEEEVLSG